MSTNDEIRVLMETTGQKAPYMTQALKNIGGDMQSGIKQIGTLFRKEGFAEGLQLGKQIGEKNGAVKGSLVTLAAVSVAGICYWIYERHETKKTMKLIMDAKTELPVDSESVITSQEMNASSVIKSNDNVVGDVISD